MRPALEGVKVTCILSSYSSVIKSSIVMILISPSFIISMGGNDSKSEDAITMLKHYNKRKYTICINIPAVPAAAADTVPDTKRADPNCVDPFTFKWKDISALLPSCTLEWLVENP